VFSGPERICEAIGGWLAQGLGGYRKVAKTFKRAAKG
jgi:hypothetical protein